MVNKIIGLILLKMSSATKLATNFLHSIVYVLLWDATSTTVGIRNKVRLEWGQYRAAAWTYIH